MRLLHVAALALLVFGCGSRRAPNVVVTPAQTSVVVAPAGGGSCQSTLAVGPVRTRPGCTIDERVSGQTTALSHACGDGPAAASFADARFEGGVTNGQLDIAIETAFDFSDGCRWRTKQRIQGTLASGQLAYTYEEQPDPGQRGCAQGCLANAEVQVY
ncbi:MAG: hypothetical protein H6719_00655 [Sandaracinaceae bacterium]|nr:hypothetical protein [Sandaracinaceae bacterium]